MAAQFPCFHNQRLMPILGAHVSVAGGLHNAFANAEKIGAKALQIFGASPRQWKAKLPDPEILKKYKEAKVKGWPVFQHASYLPNFATPDDELYAKSIANLTAHLQIAEAIGSVGLIYHIGSHKNSDPDTAAKRISDGMHQVLKNVPGKANLIMENSAGGGQKMGLTAEEIGKIYQVKPHPRIKVCIDTAHAFGAGVLETYSPSELDKFKKACDKGFGLENLIVLHVNDSKVPFNSQKDRHENIGEGHIGLQAFQNLADDKFFSTIPWLLEVPGFEKGGPDKKNIDIINSLFKK